MEPKDNVRTWLASEEYQRRKLELNKEINSYPVKIDRECFKKTPLERELAKIAKSEWKKAKKADLV